MSIVNRETPSCGATYPPFIFYYLRDINPAENFEQGVRPVGCASLLLRADADGARLSAWKVGCSQAT